jgi:hypothetical protein
MATIKKKTAKQIAGTRTRAAQYAEANKAEDKVRVAAINLSRGVPKSKAGKLARSVSNPTKAEYKAATAMQKQRAAETDRAYARSLKKKKK